MQLAERVDDLEDTAPVFADYVRQLRGLSGVTVVTVRQGGQVVGVRCREQSGRSHCDRVATAQDLYEIARDLRTYWLDNDESSAGLFTHDVNRVFNAHGVNLSFHTTAVPDGQVWDVRLFNECLRAFIDLMTQRIDGLL